MSDPCIDCKQNIGICTCKKKQNYTAGSLDTADKFVELAKRRFKDTIVLASIEEIAEAIKETFNKHLED